MLELKNVTKRYEIGDFKQTALNDISVNFRTQEFVAVLGPSGSGKTTLLNMVGGLDRYDKGDMLINRKSTQHFSDQEWDSYRNHAVGFIFQNYNLITHTSVLANVEIGMTLSGLSPMQRRNRALEVLEQVGLKDHVHKKPNQLSGGQMQRVAIARALANDPEIILADEPTGAIDSETSAKIMALIQEIAKDKLVIMVTHDENIANTYADRVISLKDGRIQDDTNPFIVNGEKSEKLSFKETSMAFKQALKLSFNNLKTKKFRTLITTFAGSIGIIGVALVLALANGLNQEIDQLERSTLVEFPIQIDPIPFDLESAEQGGPFAAFTDGDQWERFPDDDKVFPLERELIEGRHINDIRPEFIDHLDTLDETLYNEISIDYRVNMNVLYQLPNDQVITLNNRRVNFNQTIANQAFFDESYDLLAGQAPSNKNELLLVVDEYNRLNVEILNALGLSSEVDSYDFQQFFDKQFKVLRLDEFYQEDETTNRFSGPDDLEAKFNSQDGIELSIVGIARINQSAFSSFLSPGIKYHPDLLADYMAHAQDARIGEAQKESSDSVITGLPLSQNDKQTFLQQLGVDQTPRQIRIYPTSFEAKTGITDHLDAFNETQEEGEEIRYTDLAGIVIALIGDVIDGVSYVLIAFSSISLVVSSIMIGIITYISVLERTKEIGILRSLGARKRDISRVFNAETTIIGFSAGLMGVIIAFILTFPINIIINRLIEDVNNLANLPFFAMGILIFISISLTFIAGLIPARIAAAKHPVDALRID